MSNILNETFQKHLDLLNKHLNENSLNLVLEYKFTRSQAIKILKGYGINDAGNLSSDELKKAYRILSKKYHPDVGGNQEDFKKIVAAYETLKNVSSDSSSNQQSSNQRTSSNTSSNNQSSNQSSNQQSSNQQTDYDDYERSYGFYRNPEAEAEIAKKRQELLARMERYRAEMQRLDKEREELKRKVEAEFEKEAISGNKGELWKMLYQRRDKLRQSIDDLLKRQKFN